MATPTGVTGISKILNLFELLYNHLPLLGAQLSQGRWLFAFALVTSLFFTCEYPPTITDATSHNASPKGASRMV